MTPEDWVTLYHGDCLEQMKNIAPKSVDLVFCDLPYGTTQNDWDKTISLYRLWCAYWRVCKGAVVLTSAQPFTSALVMSGLQWFKYEWIWEKTAAGGFLNAARQPLRNHESVLVFGQGAIPYKPQFTFSVPYTAGHKAQGGDGSSNYGAQGSWVTESDGRRFPTSVQRIAKDRSKLHPTQKPEALMTYMIKTYSNVGDVVLDNCMGSGSTGVAAIRAKRRFIGIERDPKIFAGAEARIALARQGVVI